MTLSFTVVLAQGECIQIVFTCPSCLLFAVPAAVPLVREKVEENGVRVSWVEVPREQRGGCITGYTIYLESDGRQRKACTASKCLSVSFFMRQSILRIAPLNTEVHRRRPRGRDTRLILLPTPEGSLQLSLRG